MCFFFYIINLLCMLIGNIIEMNRNKNVWLPSTFVSIKSAIQCCSWNIRKAEGKSRTASLSRSRAKYIPTKFGRCRRRFSAVPASIFCIYFFLRLDDFDFRDVFPVFLVFLRVFVFGAFLRPRPLNFFGTNRETALLIFRYESCQ